MKKSKSCRAAYNRGIVRRLVHEATGKRNLVEFFSFHPALPRSRVPLLYCNLAIPTVVKRFGRIVHFIIVRFASIPVVECSTV